MPGLGIPVLLGIPHCRAVRAVDVDGPSDVLPDKASKRRNYFHKRPRSLLHSLICGRMIAPPFKTPASYSAYAGGRGGL